MDRIEADFIGPVTLPPDVLYGVHTLRAKRNFDVSKQRLQDFPELVQSMAMVKKAAALANLELGLLDANKAHAIANACDRLIACKDIDGNFPVDMMQGGAGTSTNMNVNEVLANLALVALGARVGDYEILHPNDDLNRSQSTNDVYPTAIRLTILRALDALSLALVDLRDAFRGKGTEYAHVIKVGRTQLQDAVPLAAGREFDAFAEMIEEDLSQIQHATRLLTKINLGGSAIGTSINVPPAFPNLACSKLAKISGYDFTPANDLVAATSDTGDLVTVSSTLKRIAVKLTKVCNDLRLLGSGPIAGLAEIRMPVMQAGSSIMPGKVNPVILEMVNQVAFQVIGNDLTVALAASAGQLQLNAMEPLIILNILQSMRLLTRGTEILKHRCIDGIEVDAERCRFLLEQSLVVATPLAMLVGYAKAANLSRKALLEKRSLRTVLEEDGCVSVRQINELFENSATHTSTTRTAMS